MDESTDAPLSPAEQAVLITKLAVLAERDRDRYRKIRAAAWELVVARSGRSDFPSDCS